MSSFFTKLMATPCGRLVSGGHKGKGFYGWTQLGVPAEHWTRSLVASPVASVSTQMEAHNAS